MSKKFYMAPESEELMLMTEGFLAASNDILITRNDAWTAGETMGSDSPHCDKDEC